MCAAMERAHGLRRAAIALGVLLAYCPCVLALDPSLDVSQYAHTAWKVSEGFSKGVIFSIAQTPDGYLWLGTEFGLLRFDGVRNTEWQPPKGERLPSNDIRNLRAARDGRLWIGTTKGLASWKDGRLTHYPELDGQGVEALLEDHEGTIWVGMWAPPVGRLCTIQAGKTQCYGEDGRFGSGVTSLYEDSGGNLWAGGMTGLWRWKSGPPKLYPMPDPALRINALIEGDDGELLIAQNSGITQLRLGKIEAYPFPAGQQFRANTLLRDRHGGLWIGASVDAGLLHVHQGSTDLFTRSDGLSGDAVTCFFEDREGNIWAATVDGLDRFREFAVPSISVKQGLSSRGLSSVLAARDGSVWIGSSDGLNRWKNGQITVYRKRSAQAVRGGAKQKEELLERNHTSVSELIAESGLSATRTVRAITASGLPDDTVDSLFEDHRGRIWVGTVRGVAILESDQFIPISSVSEGIVYSIAGDSAGEVWISHEDGLFHLLRANVVERIPWATLGRKDVATALLRDSVQDALWLGYLGGGIAYFSNGQVRASYTAADGLGTGYVSDFRFDHDGTLWVSTEGGLSRVKNNRVTTLNSTNGLPCDTVHWMMEDDAHSVWLYMACGLVRIARPELDAWAADPKRTILTAVFDSSDGVRSHSFTSGYSPLVTKSPNGRLWFLPFGDVSVIDPRHLAFNKLPPPVHIEQIVADGKTYDAARGLRLPPGVRNLEIDYTALSLVDPEKVHFRFMLEGQDKDWRAVVNRRRAEYSNLSPGNYRFRVMACNNSGVWNEQGETLDFAIAPEFWQTNWFRALCVAGFLALLWALYRLRVRQLRRQEKKLHDVIETIPAIAWTALPDGWVDFSNHHWEEYTGLSLEEGAGSGWEVAVHPKDVKRHAEKWRASVASGEPFESEARYRRADGEYRWFLVRAVPLRDGGGKILKWYGTKTDIEDRKRAEQLQADLAHINRVTTLGELTSSLAHEIKQPIAATVINAHTCLRWLKRDRPDLDEIREAASSIVADGRRAGDIIERLQSLYKKSPPKRELVEMNEIINEMASLLRGEANRYAVSIRTDLAADLPKIAADRVQVQQVLINLMLNGIEAMKETGGVLTVKSQLGQDGRVMISVSDTGVGLPAEKADQIFDAFFTTKPQGSGMGLAISRSIVQSHGGRLWATANDGRGAAFHFTLPTAAEVVKVAATEPNSVSTGTSHGDTE
ncbi:two-component regulator propeller domain-containing protein [Edaphobacter modestus]|uniref:histidine kinase n=1 Tax=Edaphobacter modestus TaxID=388466 RepID=A0A4Q7Z0I7_9BACT|nr:two-component regulator propeller domain-containing protein [Edaphobacter modestus]RZU43727.1 PAS domain S-box-containing protein [Edaphobacter modestus]